LVTELLHPRTHLGLLLISEFIRTGRSLHGTINHLAVKPFSIFGRERTRAASIAPVPAVRASVPPPTFPWPARPTIARPALLSTLLTVLPVALLNTLLVVLSAAARTAPP
jgi:hypothetical protein